MALPSSFESDGVHLNADAGAHFIQYILSGVDQVLPGVPPPLASGPVSQVSLPQVLAASSYSSPPPSIPGGSPSLLGNAIASLTSMTGSLKAEVDARRLQDNLIFARLKEDQDYSLNKNREDRFTVSGLNVSQPPPSDALERKAFFKDILTSLVLEACPDLDPQPKVLDVFVNMRYGRGAPFIEARLDSAASSSAFRVAASQLAKVENSKFAGLFVANSVTLTTRVRIEILRALAKLMTTETEEAFVQSFSSRLMLHYQSREHVKRPLPGTNRSYSFVEAVGRWGDKLTTVALLPAYRRARPAFIGCLEQYFVVLRESEPREDPSSGFDQLFASGSNSFPVSRGGRGGCRPFRGGRQSGSGRGRFTAASSSSLAWPHSSRKRVASNEVQDSPSKKKEMVKDKVDTDETSADAEGTKSQDWANDDHENMVL